MYNPETAPEVASSTSEIPNDTTGTATGAFYDAYQFPSTSNSDTTTGDGPDSTNSTGLDGANESGLFAEAYSESSLAGMESTTNNQPAASEQSLAEFDLDAFQLVDDSGAPIADAKRAVGAAAEASRQRESTVESARDGADDVTAEDVSRPTDSTPGADSTESGNTPDSAPDSDSDPNTEKAPAVDDTPSADGAEGSTNSEVTPKAEGNTEAKSDNEEEVAPADPGSDTHTQGASSVSGADNAAGEASDTRGDNALSNPNELTEDQINDRIDKLDSDSFHEREQARKDLVGAKNRDQVLERLRNTVKDPDSLEQQTQARQAIAEMGESLKEDGRAPEGKRESLSAERISELIRGLDADTFQEREDATRALARAGNPEEVMKQLADAMKNPLSREQAVRARGVARQLGANASQEQLQSMYDSLGNSKLSRDQRQLYEAAVNGGLANAEGPVTFRNEQGRVTGIYDGSLDNASLTAKYDADGNVTEATVRGVTFSRNEQGNYVRSDGITHSEVTVSENGVRFGDGNGSTEWAPNGDTKFFDRSGNWTGTYTRDGKEISPDRFLPLKRDGFR
ncbi:MAG: hypothetical protein K2Z81_06370 [Cyanobacteria bacterium]|nr:hypothetical protein [Cyanobacteriota bacterium]